MSSIHLSKEQKQVISVVTFGNALEGFEIYSYAYMAPILSQMFFSFSSYIENLIGFFILFGSGFIARPFGAVVFGRMGDLLGRKTAFVSSIVMMTLPTFLMGCLPTYAKLGIYAPVLLCLLRLLQAIPVSGEAPGTFCFLYEKATNENRRFMTSWGAYGNQIGAIVAVIETLLMDQFLSKEFMMNWGWRISFWTGGAIGLFGIYLRCKLHETDLFKQLQDQHKIDNEKVFEVAKRREVKIGIGFGVLNAATFYLIATYIPTYFGEVLGLTENGNAVVSLFVLGLTTILLPTFGSFAKNRSLKKIFISCTLLITALTILLYYFIVTKNTFFIGATGILFVLPVTCMTALLPYILVDLFPPEIRFTGVSLSFNLVDGIIGGFTPAIALLLVRYLDSQAGFCWFLLLCAGISLVSYRKIRD